jgi:hypothetical protein
VFVVFRFSIVLISILIWTPLSVLAKDGQPNGPSPELSPCTELLRKPILDQFVQIQDAPGLRVLASEIKDIPNDYASLLQSRSGAFLAHELVSSARYAKYVSDTKGEQVLLVPEIDNKSIPGFDGVVLDAQGVPIANLSLKTLLNAEASSHALESIALAMQKALRFSDPIEWVFMVNGVKRDANGVLHLQDGQSETKLHERRRWLAKSFAIFGLHVEAERPRPSRIVVDIRAKSLMPTDEEIAEIRKGIQDSKGLIESVIFLKGDAVLEVH